MRKGFADIGVRTKISSDRIQCFTEQIATLTEDLSVGQLIQQVSKPVISSGMRFRGLEVTGKDLALLQEIADLRYNVDAITNKHLQSVLKYTPWSNGLKGKKLSARISRNLRLLREHGLIKILPHQHRYILTQKGRLLTSALNQFLSATIAYLTNIAV